MVIHTPQAQVCNKDITGKFSRRPLGGSFRLLQLVSQFSVFPPPQDLQNILGLFLKNSLAINVRNRAGVSKHLSLALSVRLSANCNIASHKPVNFRVI